MSARQPVSLLNLALNTVVYQLACSRGLEPLTAAEKGTLPSTVHVEIDLKLQALRSVFRPLDIEALSNVQRFELSCCCGLIGQAKQLRRYQRTFDRSFRLACKFGQLETAQWVWSICDPHEQQAMLSAENYAAFRFACIFGHLETAMGMVHL